MNQRIHPSATYEPLIAVERATYRYPARHGATSQPPAIDAVSLRVAPGEYVALLGHNGSGKSTLARLLNGLFLPESGRVRVLGHDTRERGSRRLVRERVGMIFSDPDSQIIATVVSDDVAWGLAARGLPRHVIMSRADAALAAVGLAEARGRAPHELSGGQRQRLAIARALAAEPKMIIADEPVTALDASAQAQVVSLLLSLVRELDMGLLFISHDLALVHEIADRTAVMYLGRIVELAPTRQLMATPRHPYTQALVRAIPQISATPTLPVALLGEVPDGANIPAGCRFRPRCPHAQQVCLTEPVLRPALDSLVSCWRAEELSGEGIQV